MTRRAWGAKALGFYASLLCQYLACGTRMQSITSTCGTQISLPVTFRYLPRWLSSVHKHHVFTEFELNLWDYTSGVRSSVSTCCIFGQHSVSSKHSLKLLYLLCFWRTHRAGSLASFQNHSHILAWNRTISGSDLKMRLVCSRLILLDWFPGSLFCKANMAIVMFDHSGAWKQYT